MSKKRLFERSRGRLFKPKHIRGGSRASAYLAGRLSKDVKLKDKFDNTNLHSTASFRYGDKPFIVSTQQLNVDWSRFENHTFFHSAVANVNEAFDRIINFYPIDGTQKQIEEYEDSLTGFEKYVLDIFPKNVGYLVFSGTVVGESQTNGTQISVKDKSGFNIKSISSNQTGNSVLDPLKSPFSIDFFIKIPEQANDNQILVQKKNSLANNFTLALSQSSSTKNCELHFGITSGSNFSVVSGSIDKGSFVHIYAMYDLFGDRRTKLLINDTVHSSSQASSFGTLFYNASDITIGAGEDARIGSVVFNSKQTFSGSIDDFKYFHSVDPVSKVKKRKVRSFYRDPNDPTLKLYYRFNEPFGTYTGNNLVLDSSGNSLHSTITNFEIENRLTASDVPVLSEDLKRSPILFPSFSNVVSLNTILLSSASLYDDYNPNLITNLIPKHYFQDASDFKDFTEELARLENNFESFSNNKPGQKVSEIPATQLMIKLLLSYAKHFDELKLLTDAITSFRHTQYNDFDTTPDPLLSEKAKLLNVTLPDLFSTGEVDQLFEGVNLTENGSRSLKSLVEVQNLIWRRIITEAPRTNLFRGTIRSIKSAFRSAGIEPDNILSIREFGGSKIKSLEGSRELRRDVYKFLSFSGSFGKNATTFNAQGYPTNKNIPRLKSAFLSGSRIQVGRPEPRGTFIKKDIFKPHGLSNNLSDGLFTSGSFTYEAFYTNKTGYRGVPESLVRLHVTGTDAPSNSESVVANLVASNNYLRLYFQESPTQAKTNLLFLTGVNVFDNNIWYVSFGKTNTHDLNSFNTSSYFLRAASQINGDLVEQYATASIFEEYNDSVLKNISSYNTSGSFVVIGSQSLAGGSSGKFLNRNSASNNEKITNFHGFVTNIRFFSKNTTHKEYINRAKNYGSFGVQDPKLNYNYVNAMTGAFERLIFHTDAKQGTSNSNASGEIRLFDFSQNNLHLQVENFEVSKNVFKNMRVDFEVLSDKFDVNYSKDKIRIRSFQDAQNLDQSFFSTIAPVHEVLPSEESMDDNRLSVDMSVMKGLNENIFKMFNNFEALDDAFGQPNLIFSENYHEAAHLRDVYFNNVIEVLNLQKYRQLFKWIDNSFTDVIYSLVPRTTNFLGVNFIYESHVLERSKFRYLYDEIYMKSLQRDSERGNIFLSQFVGRVKKH